MPVHTLRFLVVITLIVFVSTALAGEKWDKFKKSVKEVTAQIVDDLDKDPKDASKSDPNQQPQNQPKIQDAAEVTKPIILTIDGVDFKLYGRFAVWPGAEGRGSSYLREYVNEWDMVTQKNSHWVAWSGNVKDTDKAVVETKGIIEQVYKVAQLHKQPMIIVAHSWGGVLASRALAELGYEHRLSSGAIDLLVTMGTPVRNETFLDLGGESPTDSVMKGATNTVKRWINYHNKEDVYSSDFSYGKRVSTVEVSSNQEKIHSSYYKDPKVWNRIERDSEAFLKTLSTPVTSTKFVVGDHVETTGNLNVRRTAGGDLVGKQFSGSRGSIVGGPVASGEYVYWQVDYNDDIDGWSVESSLRLYNAPAPDAPVPVLKDPVPREPHSDVDLFGMNLGMDFDAAMSVIRKRIPDLLDANTFKGHGFKPPGGGFKEASINLKGAFGTWRQNCVDISLPEHSCISRLVVVNFLQASPDDSEDITEELKAEVDLIEDFQKRPGVSVIHKITFIHYLEDKANAINPLEVATRKYGSPDRNNEKIRTTSKRVAGGKKETSKRVQPATEFYWDVSSPMGRGTLTLLTSGRILKFKRNGKTRYATYAITLSLEEAVVKDMNARLEKAFLEARKGQEIKF